MWKQGYSGRSSALERAEAALFSRRGGAGASAAVRFSTRVSSALEPVSSHSQSSFSSVSPHRDQPPGKPKVPNPSSNQALEVGRSVSVLDSGVSRFLKKTSVPTAKDQPEEKTFLQTPRPAALSRPAQPETRFGKGEQNGPPSSAEHTTVQKVRDVPKEQPRRFVKTTVRLREEHHSLSPVQAHAAPKRSPSPPSPTPSPPLLSPSPPGLSPSPLGHSLSPPGLSPSPLGHSLSPPGLSLSPLGHSLSPQVLSPSPAGRSSSADSALGEVQSLEELFPVEEVSEDLSEQFQINLLDLDELEPAVPPLQEDPVDKTVKEDLRENSLEEPEEEDEYLSDFESDIQTESLSQPVVDNTQSLSPPHTERSEDSRSSLSPPHTESSEDSRRSLSPVHSEYTQDSLRTPSSPRTSPSPVHSGDSSSRSSSSATPRARSPEASVGHSPQPLFQIPSTKDKPQRPVLRGHSPSLHLLMESLRQQLELTSHFISSSREHRARVLMSLGPPNYKYNTLEDTQELILKLKADESHSQKTSGKQ